jgi:hypothetical protein
MTSPAGTRETREHGSEVKFLVSSTTADQIRERARELLEPDPYGDGPSADRYTVTTLYFDTGARDVYERRGSYGRAKYRVRRYGSSDRVFLERKLRTRNWLNKRRTPAPIDALALLTAADVDTAWDGRWFRSRLDARRLNVVCQVGYRRTARVGETEHGPIRLTLDEDIQAVNVNSLGFQPGTQGTPVTKDVIVEMKFRGPMPAVFKQVAEEFRLEPAQVSKYRLAVAAMRQETGGEEPAPSVIQHA